MSNASGIYLASKLALPVERAGGRLTLNRIFTLHGQLSSMLAQPGNIAQLKDHSLFSE